MTADRAQRVQQGLGTAALTGRIVTIPPGDAE
jgi:hypothetical protein